MNVPPTAWSGMTLRLVPRTRSSSRSLTATGCAKVSVKVRLSRSPAGTRSSIWVNGSGGIGAGRCPGVCAVAVTAPSATQAAPIRRNSTFLNVGSDERSTIATRTAVQRCALPRVYAVGGISMTPAASAS